MPTISSALNTPFTPAAGDFIVQSAGGSVTLMRQNSAGAVAVSCGVVGRGEAVVVSNPVAGAVYTALPSDGKPTFQADQ